MHCLNVTFSLGSTTVLCNFELMSPRDSIDYLYENFADICIKSFRIKFRAALLKKKKKNPLINYWYLHNIDINVYI